jgi:anti-sigma factor RsiW
MKCPSEFEYSVFIDGELPEAEARQIHLHLDTCNDCNRLVASLRSENRVLVQCLQEADLDEGFAPPEFVSATSTAEPINIVKWALGVVGVAVAYKVSTGILFGFRLPPELAWLRGQDWLANPSWIFNGLSYAMDHAELLSETLPALIAVFAGAAVLFSFARALGRRGAVSSVFGVLLLIGLSSSRGYAIDIRKGTGVAAGERIDDSVIATADKGRKNVEIAGTVTGDVFLVGDLVTISGNVEGNAVIFGRRVEISGNVGGSLLGAGQSVVITGHVGRNLIGAGSNVTIGKTADIASNVIGLGSEVVVEGTTHRDLGIFAGVLDMRGSVGRDLYFRGGQASLLGSTNVGGDFNARPNKEEDIQVASGAVIGGKKDIQVVPRSPRVNRYTTVSFYVWQIVRLVAAFISGLILFRVIPWLVPAGIATGKQWLAAGGIGFLFCVGVPIAVLIVGITIIGLPIALISLALWIAGLYFSKILVAEFVGRSLTKERGALSLLAGLLVVIVAVDLPWIGGLLNFLLVVMGLGAIVMLTYRSFGRRNEVLSSL